MGHTRRSLAVIGVFGVLAVACATDPGVRTTASETSRAVPTIDTPTPTTDLTPTIGPTSTTSPATTTTSSTLGTTSTTVPFEPVEIAFGSCDDYVSAGQDEPAATWECGTLTVPMNPTDPIGATVELAVTRLSGARSRGAALVVNPGGPGTAGLPFVWALADQFPDDVRRLYDIVSWDPRGVGASEPAVRCPQRSTWADPRLLERCTEATGELMGYMSTPHHVEDLEALRVALGQERLDYVGYSYGTYLGGMYADRHPDAVGRFVLDGAIDPDAGTDRAPIFGDEPWYAADGTDEVRRRFFDLCDAAAACELGPDSEAGYQAIVEQVAVLPTDGYPGEKTIDPITLDAVLATSMYDPFNWGLLATALEDAADGDASTLDALADLLEVSNAYYGELVDPLDMEPIANLAIYCADFEANPNRPLSCDGMPDHDVGSTTLQPVDVDTPILVIGTAFDPSTPGRHADVLADRLDDAIDLSWDGVGHTAFPLNSACVDEIVEAFLLDGVVPADGTRCDFVDGFDADVDIGEYLFALPPFYVEPWLADELEPDWGDDAACMATELSDTGDRIVVHVVLGVTSAAANAAVDKASLACAEG